MWEDGGAAFANRRRDSSPTGEDAARASVVGMLLQKRRRL